MNKPQPIDHKDELGEYRARVRAGVFRRVGDTGEPVGDRERLIGSWEVALLNTNDRPKPTFRYVLGKDGTASIDIIGQSNEATVGQWQLNPDRTFSLLTWCPPIPDYGIMEPQLDEDRRHVAVLSDGRIVQWNGDGGLVLLLTRKVD